MKANKLQETVKRENNQNFVWKNTCVYTQYAQFMMSVLFLCSFHQRSEFKDEKTVSAEEEVR